MAITLTKYGRREWLGGIMILDLPITACVVLGVLVNPWWLAGLGPLLAVLGWLLWFFRDPQRTPPEGEHLLVSPADGVVSDITPVGPDSELGRRGVRIGIFMNVFNVHVNRSPCEGVVESVTHHDGAFLDVRRPDAWERNEAATIAMQFRGRRVLVRQIAGLIARRIVTDLAPGQTLARGQRIGMIKFGSRLELWLPDELRPQVCVQVGQKAQAGTTVLAAVRKETQP